MSEHTDDYLELMAEPWPEDGEVCLWSADGREDDYGVHIASVSADEVGLKARDANARRLVACWNACHGIPTEQLELDLLSDLIRDVTSLARRLENLKGAKP